MQIFSAIDNRLQITNENLLKFFVEGKRRKIANEIMFLFPHLFNSTENYKQWEYMGCEIVKDQLLTLEFLTPNNYKNIDIFRAQPFIIFKEEDSNICKYEYGGPKYMIFNLAKDCVKELNIAPHQESQSFFINQPETCDESGTFTQKYWKQTSCQPIGLVDETDPDEIQIHYNDEFLYAYCYNQTTITIFNVTTKCKNQVYTNYHLDNNFKLEQLKL